MLAEIVPNVIGVSIIAGNLDQLFSHQLLDYGMIITVMLELSLNCILPHRVYRSDI